MTPWKANGSYVFAGKLCIINCDVELPEKHQEANARLCAAAPDMRDALKSIKWKSADKDNMEFSALIPYNIMDAIMAALAKAEART